MISIGILLAGCGLYDGTEVAEAVLSALALERAGAKPVFLSIDGAQMHTVDHMTGSEAEVEARDILSESARVARGRIKSLKEHQGAVLMALIIPGGHGTVKNLMTNFARLGAPRELHPEVHALLTGLQKRRVPIGSISLGRTLVQTFIGEPLSQDDMNLSAGEIIVDDTRRLVFTPGFLTGASLAEVATGIDRMVRKVLEMSANPLEVID